MKKLKIVITTQCAHPYFKGIEKITKEFYDLSQAQDYYNTCQTEDEKSNGYQCTFIDLVVI